MKCDAHTNNTDPVSLGNAAADGDVLHVLFSSPKPDINPCADLHIAAEGK